MRKGICCFLVASCMSTLFVALVLAQATGKQFCPIDAKALVDKSAPRFNQYVQKGPAPKTQAKLDLGSNPIARMYRTVIRQEMSQGANFAGFYRVAIWGCGSSCAVCDC